uniref:Putative serine/threonine-protein phosphatase 4 regulatory subunit 2 n=1 Tax=Xenopsylla cheopis TaxID=163159 RepID=A0A6M2DNV6_XENCH
MENAEEVLQSLESFTKLRPKNIPRELEEYLCFVARTGDPVFHWSIIKSLFREKLLHVLTEFHDSSPGLDLPPCPNVDPFNYDTMKNCLLERIDSFSSAPFTVQRICELLTCPRKQYSRIDKYMRAIEKNILVVSSREPPHREPENLEAPLEAVLNGDGFDMHIEIEIPRNDTTSSINNIIFDSPYCITTPELATNCTNNMDKESDIPGEPHTEINLSNDDTSKAEPELSKQNTDENLEELPTSYSTKSPNPSEQEENALHEENTESKAEPAPETLSSNLPQQQEQTSEAFVPNHDAEEVVDSSETDSNLTEDSVNSETPAVVDENNLVTSDVESSNDEAPFSNVQVTVPEVQPVVNDLSDLKTDYPQINVSENVSNTPYTSNVEEKSKEDNMEKLFQIVCETVPEAATEALEAEKTTESIEEQEQVQNETSQSEPIISEPEEVLQSPEDVQNNDNIVIPPQPQENAITLVNEPEPELEPEQMVAEVVETNFMADMKPSEAIEQDQVESMDIQPESAMECEDTPVTSEPMDQ